PKVNRLPYLCVVVKAFMEAGRLDDGLSVLREVLEAAHEHCFVPSEPEAYWLKGDLLLKHNHSNAVDAESCFRRAVEIARNKSAKSLELTVRTSLARLLAKQDRDEARTMLTEIYSWFTEGFDTAYLKEAKALLEELAK